MRTFAVVVVANNQFLGGSIHSHARLRLTCNWVTPALRAVPPKSSLKRPPSWGSLMGGGLSREVNVFDQQESAETTIVVSGIGQHFVRFGSNFLPIHYSDVIMSTMSSQITGVSTLCLTVCSDADQRNHQNSASLAFVKEIHWWPVDSTHKGPVTRKMFPFDDVIVVYNGQNYLWAVALPVKWSVCELWWNFPVSKKKLCDARAPWLYYTLHDNDLIRPLQRKGVGSI